MAGKSLLVVVVALIGFVYGQQPELMDACLGCICDAASGCDTTQKSCTGDVCGPFRITRSYWTDGGKPALSGGNGADDSAFSECASDAYCAARAVQGYMNKYGKDCNNDGKIDCDDYARIHHLGGFGCSGTLDGQYENTFNICKKTFIK